MTTLHKKATSATKSSALDVFLRQGAQLYFDAIRAFVCAVGVIHIGNLGRAKVFSFHQNNILSATEVGSKVDEREFGLSREMLLALLQAKKVIASLNYVIGSLLLNQREYLSSYQYQSLKRHPISCRK